jgi:hypothetical protein
MKNLLLHIDPILRGAVTGIPAERRGRERGEQALLMLLSVMIYGGAMGSQGLFAGIARGDLWLSSLYSALKVPLLLGATFLLSLPVLFVSYTLAGLRDDFARVVASLVRMQGGLAIILGGLAPFTLLWYASVPNYQMGVLFNALMFALATLAAPMLIRRYLRGLFAADLRHRHLLWFWTLIYIFIGIQMGWVLRPFIGNPAGEVVFLRGENLDNAYVSVGEMIWGVMSR